MTFQISRDLVASRHLGQLDELHRVILWIFFFQLFFFFIYFSYLGEVAHIRILIFRWNYPLTVGSTTAVTAFKPFSLTIWIIVRVNVMFEEKLWFLLTLLLYHLINTVNLSSLTCLCFFVFWKLFQIWKYDIQWSCFNIYSVVSIFDFVVCS